MITELFIKQCEQAKEIQELCQYKMGDWFYSKYGYTVLDQDLKDEYIGDNWITKNSEIEGCKKDGFIWLLTQEQLWEKIDISKYDYIVFSPTGIESIKFSITINKKDDMAERQYNGNDFNECLLEILMKENHNKIWTGEDWIIENKDGK